MTHSTFPGTALYGVSGLNHETGLLKLVVWLPRFLFQIPRFEASSCPQIYAFVEFAGWQFLADFDLASPDCPTRCAGGAPNASEDQIVRRRVLERHLTLRTGGPCLLGPCPKGGSLFRDSLAPRNCKSTMFRNRTKARSPLTLLRTLFKKAMKTINFGLSMRTR